MAKFNGFILTEKGRELLAKGLAGETITFTRMAIGDGTSLTSERERTELVNQITTLPILNINVKRNGTCEINALLTNKSVTTGFYIKELGIFAHGNDNVEILYAYNISTSPDFVPPFSANNVVEIEYVDTIIVDQVANVTAVIDPSITYITKKYADENYLVSSKLAEILGLQFGGNIQDIGNKTKGKFYYDSVTKFYYECIVNNSLTYNDSSKFRAISNKPISDKVENLFKITEYKTITLQNVQKGSAAGYSIGNIAVFNFHDIKPASRNGNAVIARLPVTPLVSIETVASAVSEESSIRISVDREGAVRIISGGILPETLKEYTFSVTFPFAI